MPVGGRQKAGQNAHGCRFSGPIWAQKADDLSLFDLERDVVYRDIASVSLGETFDFDHIVLSQIRQTCLVAIWAQEGAREYAPKRNSYEIS